MSILVVGAGIMGRGIAYVAATEAQRNVVLVDASAEALSDSAAYFVRLAKKSGYEADALMARIVTQPSIEQAFKHTTFDFAIEAVPEHFELKKSVFQAFARYASPNTVLATNTSSIPITRIADTVEPKERVVGMHFFNPVPRMAGVEVIRTSYTDPSIIDRTVRLGQSMGKHVTICKKDIAGFIVNRILTAQILEATALLERDAGSPEEIDRIMKHAARLPMGPFQLSDMIGLDTVLALMNVIYEDSNNDPRYKPSPTVEKLVSQGKLGTKTGEGFYMYNKNNKDQSKSNRKSKSKSSKNSKL